MPTNLEEKKIVQSSGYSEERALQWVNAINKFNIVQDRQPIDFADVLPQAIENAKSFTGVDAATGQGLIETRVDTPITFTGNRGGVFINSGIHYKPNSGFNVIFNSFSLNGTYAQIACGTATAQEISTFATGTATLLRERAEIEGCEDVLARTPDRTQLIAAFENALENEKLVLSDRKVAAAITGNAGVAAINPAGLATYGAIADAMQAMTGNLGGLYSEPGGSNHSFFMNSTVFSKLMREQDAMGRFMNGSFFEKAFVNGRRPNSGLVGFFDGYPVYLTQGILSTYAVNASGVITGQTGGTASAVLFGLPYTVGLARGVAEYDTITVFDPKNDRQAYLEGEVTIGAATYMAAVLKAAAAWNYFAVA